MRRHLVPGWELVMTADGAVVVGVDGSSHSTTAVTWVAARPISGIHLSSIS